MNKVVFLYQGIEPLTRIVVVGTAAYFSLVFLLRVSGKRSLAQLNAFDFIVTVALGSILGRGITAKGMSLAENVTAFVTLLGLQYIVSWLTVRFSSFENVITATPSLLYFRGQFLHKAMREQRVTKSQLLAVVRANKINSLQAVDAIIMESAGTLAVIKKETDEESVVSTILDNVK